MRNPGVPPKRRSASGREKAPPKKDPAPPSRPAPPAPDAADDAITRSFRGYPERDVWTQIPMDQPGAATEDLTMPVPTARITVETESTPKVAEKPSGRRRATRTDEAARGAWMHEMTLDGGLSEEEAARLWDSDPPLSGNEMFARGFHSRDREVAEKDRQVEIGKDDLRQLGRQVEGLLTELGDRYADLHRLETELAGARRALRAVSALAAAGVRPDVASDPAKLRALAVEALGEPEASGEAPFLPEEPGRPDAERSEKPGSDEPDHGGS